MNSVDETWAEINGFPDYAISNFGQVKSIRWNRILSPRRNSYGLLRVIIYKDRKAHDVYVHRLVAEAFITGYQPHLQVKHADDDNGNNHVYNLRFPDGRHLGHLVKYPTQPRVLNIQIVETGMTFRTVQDCAKYIGGDASSIYRVLRGERRSHLGYTFEYVEEQSGQA